MSNYDSYRYSAMDHARYSSDSGAKGTTYAVLALAEKIDELIQTIKTMEGKECQGKK